MTDLQREAIAALAEVWELSPDVRLGQLLAHLDFLGDVHLGRRLGEIDDDELVAVLCRHRAELQRRLHGDPNPPPLSGGAASSASGSSTAPQASSPAGA